MLNKDSLAQLQGLKNQMEADKEHADATVKGTQSRYGFARLDDGRDVFIPPDEMLKVFPGDRVHVCVRPAKNGKTVADIEKLIDSPLTQFTGHCVRKGKALFVSPDVDNLSRWLFIPPQARNGVKEGDFVHCAIMRHPIKDGRPQAKVLNVLGKAGTPGIENLYCQAKHGLMRSWPESLDRFQNDIQTDTAERHDLSHLEFVTIDASKTLDIDDALYAESSNEGWTLYVAIADPTAIIKPNSELEKHIAARATSVYFHGDVLPMLPDELSQQRCALVEGEDRPALVCKMSVSDTGAISAYEFIEATIRSRAKLSYYGVDRYLAGDSDNLMSNATPLEALYQVFRALNTYRREHELVMEDRQEYRWVLNEDKKVQSIEPSEKLLSQKLVEECMIAANRCGANFLKDQQRNGPFVVHAGFREDRLDEAKEFLQRLLPEQAERAPDNLKDYREIMLAASSEEQSLPLRAMLNRLLARAELSESAKDHMGLSLSAYSNCTSPLRKYTDYLAHRQIKNALQNTDSAVVNDDILGQLSEQLQRARAATFEAERWLAGDYLAQIAKENASFNGVISHINSSGFHVRLNDNGLEGFVDLRKDPEKFSFDKWSASLTSTTRRFALEQPVTVIFDSVDSSNHSAQFKLPPDCGLKPPKEKAAPKPSEDA